MDSDCGSGRRFDNFLRQLEWDAICTEYLPHVAEADMNEDHVACFLVLDELAKLRGEDLVMYAAISYLDEVTSANAGDNKHLYRVIED